MQSLRASLSRRRPAPRLTLAFLLTASALAAATDRVAADDPALPPVPPVAVEEPAPPPPPTPLPAEPPVLATAVLAAPPPVPPLGGRTPWQWGPVTVHPHLFYRLLRGDGIQSRPGQPATSTVHTLAPGLQWTLGSRWTADYTLSRTLYSNPELADSVDHAAYVAGTVGREDLTIFVRESFSSSTAPLVETGQPTKQDVLATSLRSNLELGRDLAAEVDLAQTSQWVRDFNDTREWSGLAWLRYRFPSGLQAAGGLGGGWVDVSQGSDMNYVRAEVRLSARLADKLALEVEGGMEHRRFTQARQRSRDNPVLRGGLRYTPFETTVVAVGASREVTTSYFADQFVENRRLGLDVSQRLLGHFTLALGWAWQKSRYISTAMLADGRDDESRAVNARLQTTLFRRLTAGVLYQRTRNASNEPGFGFRSNQVGLELGLRF